MTRTFHHRFTLGARCGVILCTLLALYLFWTQSALMGILVVLVDVLIIERVLHSEYVIDDRRLIIRRGRFARTVTIPLDAIHSCRPVPSLFGLVRYLLIEYGAARVQAVEPAEEASFIRCLRQHTEATEPAEGTPA